MVTLTFDKEREELKKKRERVRDASISLSKGIHYINASNRDKV